MAAESAYQGCYSGVYSGYSGAGYSGIWFFEVDRYGTCKGMAWVSIDPNFTVTAPYGSWLSGKVDASGGYAIGLGNGVNMNGNISPQGVSGLWQRGASGGTVTGTRNPNLANFAGEYEGVISGSQSGTWNATVDADGSCSGSIQFDGRNDIETGRGGLDTNGRVIWMSDDKTALRIQTTYTGVFSGEWRNAQAGERGSVTGSFYNDLNAPAEAIPPQSVGEDNGCFINVALE